jgi:hypothetical protein
MMVNKDVAACAANTRPAARSISLNNPTMRLMTAGFAAGTFLALASTAALAQDFDVFDLKGGEVRQVAVWPTNPYLRICNDSTSAGAVAVGVGRGEPEALQPGMCTTDDVVDKIVLANKSMEPATVTYRTTDVDSRGGS